MSLTGVNVSTASGSYLQNFCSLGGKREVYSILQLEGPLQGGEICWQIWMNWIICLILNGKIYQTIILSCVSPVCLVRKSIVARLLLTDKVINGYARVFASKCKVTTNFELLVCSCCVYVSFDELLKSNHVVNIEHHSCYTHPVALNGGYHLQHLVIRGSHLLEAAQ